MAEYSKPLVLAVDDSILMQDLIKRALGDYYQVVVAGSAIEALAILNYKPVSVLLLDICMPGINGLDLCRTVRNLPRFSKLPIIMLTSKNTAMDKVQGRLSGATDYLTKPFDANQLRQVVDRFVAAIFLEAETVDTLVDELTGA